MERRDFLLDQIEQIGKVLAKILSDLMGRKNSGNVSIGIEASNSILQTELDVNMEEILTLSAADLEIYLSDRKFHVEHLEMLSDYLFECGQAESENRISRIKLEKSLLLLDIADKISNTISLYRNDKKRRIEDFLYLK